MAVVVFDDGHKGKGKIMATKMFCDKCGKGIHNFATHKNVVAMPSVILQAKGKDTVGSVSTTYDLCDGCVTAVREFITGDKIERIDE